MSVVLTFGIVVIVFQLMQNTKLRRRIRVLEIKRKDQDFEMRQVEEMLLKYGKEDQKEEGKKTSSINAG